MPVDRIFFGYNHYTDIFQMREQQAFPPGPRLFRQEPLDRYTLGVEKTFFNAWTSVEVRMPFNGSFDATLPSFSVSNGSLEGIDLWFELRRARARLDGDTLPERGDAARRTTFQSLSASGVVEDALLTNRDLNGRLDFMTVDGSGTVNLLDDTIAFDLVAMMVDGPVLQSDPEMVKYAGKTLPLKVSGTIAEPSVLPDFAAIVRQQVSQQVDDEVDEARQEAQQEVDEKVDEARERVRDRLRGLLER